MKKITFIVFLAAIISVTFLSCGDDDTNPNNGGTGGNTPNINMKVGSVYTFNIDSLLTNGQVRETRFISVDSCMTQGSFFFQSNVFQIRSVVRDSIIPTPLVIDTFYVRYEGGKFYQYGVIQLIDPAIAPTWDLIADFTLSMGTVWNIATNVPLNIIPGATANITGKVAVDTTFHTSSWGNLPVNCYRSEVVADVLVSGFSIGKVYVDYYIGDADPATNPSGLVRLKLRPFNIGFAFDGFDRRMKKWFIP